MPEVRDLRYRFDLLNIFRIDDAANKPYFSFLFQEFLALPTTRILQWHAPEQSRSREHP